MLDFRKVLFALTVAGLGLVSTASAQVSCNGFLAPLPTLAGIRAEGATEQLPKITIGNCSGNTDTSTVSVVISTNATITNSITNSTSGATDAIGFISGFSQPTPSTTPSTGSITLVQGVLANNTLTFTFSVTPSTSAAGGTIAISNVRVNASTLPALTTITETVSSGAGLIITGNASAATTAPVALTQTSLAKPSFTAYANVAICNTTAASVNAVGTVVVKAAFTGAFTTAAQELTTETNGLNGATVANNPNVSGTISGSIIAVTFNNLVTGATYYVPSVVSVPAVAGAAGPPVVLAENAFTLQLITSPASTAPIVGGQIGGSNNGGNTTPAAATTGSTITGVASFTPTNGSFTAYYSVTSDNNTSTTNPIPDATPGFNATPPTAPTSLTLYEVVPNTQLATATAAPSVSLSLVGATAPLYAQFGTNTTATVSASTTSFTAGGILTGCNTTLIFPYILTSSGYDTGIELSNAAPGSSVAGNTLTTTTTGSCTMMAYGSSGFGAAAITPFALMNSPISITAGTVNAFQLSTALPTADPVFVGYMIATCNFQGAHGFGFVFGGANGATGGAGLSYGYLAPILVDVFTPAGGTPTSTPINTIF
jgi:hypothetical protein